MRAILIFAKCIYVSNKFIFPKFKASSFEIFFAYRPM
jgi:hypothetical protein